MLKLTWIEFFFRTIPETLILICGIHVIVRQSFNIRNYIGSSILIAILVFFIRWLPIYFGVHMIIDIILTISIMASIGIPIIKSISSTLLMYFMFSSSEFINMIILSLLNIDTNIQLLEPVKKCVLGIPSLVITLVFIITMNYLLKMKEGMQHVSN